MQKGKIYCMIHRASVCMSRKDYWGMEYVLWLVYLPASLSHSSGESPSVSFNLGCDGIFLDTATFGSFMPLYVTPHPYHISNPNKLTSVLSKTWMKSQFGSVAGVLFGVNRHLFRSLRKNHTVVPHPQTIQRPCRDFCMNITPEWRN